MQTNSVLVECQASLVWLGFVNRNKKTVLTITQHKTLLLKCEYPETVETHIRTPIHDLDPFHCYQTSSDAFQQS